MHKGWFLTVVVLGALLAVAPASAQTATATLSGTVFDESGAVVPDVSVTLVNKATSAKREVTSSREGYFVITLLPPGSYTLRAQRENFSPSLVPNIVLNTTDQRHLEIKLKVGGMRESITVEANTTGVDTSSAVSTVVDRQFVENIPMNGRSFQALLLLTPGVLMANSDGQLSFNGLRTTTNYFTIDGVSANIGVVSMLGGIGREPTRMGGSTPGFNTFGGTNNLISLDALEEFKIQSSTYSAAHGRQPGGQVQLTSRGGTNQYHGSLFEYFRNDILDANDWFRNNAGLPKPPMRQNDFGGVLGGPIIENRTFFFFSYEGLRLRQPVSQTSINVPSLETRNNPALDPTLKLIADSYPLPNGPVNANGSAKFTYSVSDPKMVNSYSLRVDHTFNSKFTVFGRFSTAPSDGNRWFGNVRQLTAVNTKTATVGATALLTKNLSNEFRGNYSINQGWFRHELAPLWGSKPAAREVFFPAKYDGPLTQVSWVFPGSQNLQLGTLQDNLQRQFNFVDTLNWNAGAHSFKFGVDYRHLFPKYAPTDYSLTVTFTSTANLFLERADRMTVAQNESIALVFKNFSAYVQDTWRIAPRVTLDLGLRWEYNPPPQGKGGKYLYTVLGAENPASMKIAPEGTPMYRTPKTEFAPRIGIAYQIGRQTGNETVIRAAYGLYYDLGSGTAGGAANTFPHGATKSYPIAGVPPNYIQFPFTDQVLAPPTFPSLTAPFKSVQFTAFHPDYVLPRTHQWSLSVQQSLGRDQVLTLSYVGNAARRLLRRYSLAIASTNPTNPDFPGSTIYFTRNDPKYADSSDYSALQAQFVRRLSKGLQVLANHTWAHAIDTNSDDNLFMYLYGTANESIFDVNSPGSQRGNSNFDRRHTFNMALTYELPKPGWGKSGLLNVVNKAIIHNWALDANFKAQSGIPVNVNYYRNFGSAGNFNFRPDLVIGESVWVDDPAAPGGKKLNVNAFALPANAFSGPGVVTHGNLPRNSIHGIGASQIDLAIRRQFPITESVNLQFRAEMFNVLNHPNFGPPGSQLGQINSSNQWVPAGNFGEPTQMLGATFGTSGLSSLYTIGGPRSMQFALKLVF